MQMLYVLKKRCKSSSLIKLAPPIATKTGRGSVKLTATKAEAKSCSGSTLRTCAVCLFLKTMGKLDCIRKKVKKKGIRLVHQRRSTGTILFPILANISIFGKLGDRHICITLKIKCDGIVFSFPSRRPF